MRKYGVLRTVRVCHLISAQEMLPLVFLIKAGKNKTLGVVGFLSVARPLQEPKLAADPDSALCRTFKCASASCTLHEDIWNLALTKPCALEWKLCKSQRAAPISNCVAPSCD